MLMAGIRAPKYPESLRAAGVQDTVLATFVVDSLGRVEPESFQALNTPNALFVSAVRSIAADGKVQAGRGRGSRRAPACQSRRSCSRSCANGNYFYHKGHKGHKEQQRRFAFALCPSCPLEFICCVQCLRADGRADARVQRYGVNFAPVAPRGHTLSLRLMSSRRLSGSSSIFASFFPGNEY